MRQTARDEQHRSEPGNRAEALAGLCAPAASGAAGSRLAVLRGPAGIGKTTLLDQMLAGCDRAGHLVLRTECAAPAVRYGAARRLLAAEPPNPTKTPAPTEPSTPAPAETSAPTPDATYQADYPLMQSMHRQIVELATTAPLVLVVDNAALCDEESLRWLDFLLRRAARLSLMVVLALRSDVPPVAGRALADLLAGQQPLSIDLGPLSGSDQLAMIEQALGAPVDAEFADRVAACTGGNPLLLARLLSRLRLHLPRADEAGARQVEALGSDIVLSMMDMMLAGRTPNLVETAEAIAVLGPARVEVVAALADIPLASVQPAVEVLRAAGVLCGEPADYRLDVVRAAVLADLGFPRSEALRGRAAELLLSTGSPSADVARQLLVRAERADGPIAGGQQPRLYLGTRPDQAEIQIRLAQSLADADPFGALEMLRAVLARHTEVRARAGLAVRFVVAYLSVRRSCPAARRMADVLDAIDVELAAEAAADPGRADPTLAALLDATRILARSTDSAALTDAHATVAALTPAPVDAPTQRQLLAMLTASAGLRAASVPAALTLARRTLDIPGVLPGWATLTSALTLAYGGETAEALRTLDAAVAYNEDNAVHWNTVHALAVRALIRLDTGAIPEAVQDARLALSRSAERSWGNRVTLPRIVLAVALAEHDRADLGQARALLAEIHLPTLSGSDGSANRDLIAAWYFNAHSRVAAATGDLESALANALACGRLITESGWQHSIFLTWWAHAAWLLAELGRPAEAGDLLAHGAAMADAWRTPRARGLSLLAAGVVRGGRVGVALLTDAVAALADSTAVADHVFAQYLLGRAQLAEGNAVAARETLRRSVDEATRCGRDVLAAAARSALVSAGGRNRSVGAAPVAVLTDRERRVAELAARGMSNRSVADSLFVTVRTVEHHLTSVYRKLGLRGRTELAHALIRYDTARSPHRRPAPDIPGSAW